MLKTVIATFAIGAFGAMFLTGFGEQPGEKGKGPKKDKKGWEPGKIIPPHVREALDFTEAQQKQIDDLEKEVRTKLLKIFTEDQKARLKELNDKGPQGPPKDGDGPPDKKGKGKKDFDRPGDCGPQARCQPAISRQPAAASRPVAFRLPSASTVA
ncbi:MAG: hypothetical protein HYR84_04745 [Planctomycetes bacterium]|nr:hypothetical protein [Planctomycetota bacterium]